MKYIINSNYDIIDSEEQTAILKDDVESVYLLGKIETLILKRFLKAAEINPADLCFTVDGEEYFVDENDYTDFVKDMIEKSILIKFDGTNSSSD